MGKCMMMKNVTILNTFLHSNSSHFFFSFRMYYNNKYRYIEAYYKMMWIKKGPISSLFDQTHFVSLVEF